MFLILASITGFCKDVRIKYRKLVTGFYRFDKSGSALSKNEIFELNKNDAQRAPKNIKKVIDGLHESSCQKEVEDVPSNGSIAVAAASRYLKRQGFNKLADKHMEIACL